MPVVEKYASQGKAHKISAVPPPEEVFLEVEKILQPVFGEDTFSSETVAVQSASVVSNAQPTIMYSKRPSANWVSSLLCFVCCAIQQSLLAPHPPPPSWRGVASLVTAGGFARTFGHDRRCFAPTPPQSCPAFGLHCSNKHDSSWPFQGLAS